MTHTEGAPLHHTDDPSVGDFFDAEDDETLTKLLGMALSDLLSVALRYQDLEDNASGDGWAIKPSSRHEVVGRLQALMAARGTVADAPASVPAVDDLAMACAKRSTPVVRR